MIKLYVSYCTEYDNSAQRDGGVVISRDYNQLISYITPYNIREKGDPETYWNYSPPEEIWCSPLDYEKMDFEDGLMFGKSFKTMIFNFYKLLK